MTARFGRGKRSEAGAVAVMVAVSMVALVVTAAMVLDFGLVRMDRQENKSAADAAAISSLDAMRHVDSLGRVTGKAAPYAAVCAALSYLQVNQPELASVTGTLTDGLGNTVAGAACPLPATSTLDEIACDPDDRSTWAWFSGSADGGRLRVDIKNGYVASEDAASFPEESLTSVANNQGAAVHKGCDQLAVIVTETRTPGLGSLATSADMTFSVRSVARVDMGVNNGEVVALVTLEREDCQSLYTNGTTTDIFVDGYEDTPGMIHADSIGKDDADMCDSKKVLSVDGNNPGAIVAGDAPDTGEPGVIGIAALFGLAGAEPDNATEDITKVYAEPSEAPEGHDLVTRSPIDYDYSEGVKDTMADAVTAWATPAADVTVPSTNCSNNDMPNAAARSETGTVFFNCPSGVDYNNDVTLAASRVIFAGDVKVRSGKSFAMPYASHVYIHGRVGTPGLDYQGAFRMHTQGAAACASSAPSVRGRLVVGSGEIKSTGGSPLFQACNTAVIMMGGQTDGCVPDTPGQAPQESTLCTGGYINLAGGASTDWTAPNLVAEGRTTTDQLDLEDLAFWTESEAASSIRGSGSITLAGVFVLPNANPFSVGGSGYQNVKNSQYFARKLGAHGGGTLYMQPNPYDVSETPYYKDYSLVR